MQGDKHGFGKMNWEDNSFYEGKWDHNLYEGEGTFGWGDGRVYKG